MNKNTFQWNYGSRIWRGKIYSVLPFYDKIQS